jgi:ribosome-binding protein aMBF1 (putative translation factor)
MNNAKRKRLESSGWRFGSARDFLGLSDEEAALVETKLRLSQGLRERRTKLALSQAAVAKRLQSSQSRVAKMEAADATVSVDLLLRALFALGATQKDVASVIRKPVPSAA